MRRPRDEMQLGRKKDLSSLRRRSSSWRLQKSHVNYSRGQNDIRNEVKEYMHAKRLRVAW